MVGFDRVSNLSWSGALRLRTLTIEETRQPAIPDRRGARTKVEAKGTGRPGAGHRPPGSRTAFLPARAIPDAGSRRHSPRTALRDDAGAIAQGPPGGHDVQGARITSDKGGVRCTKRGA
jgi:hypothetical protein